ncbi:MAG: PAS domain-containing protein [Chloroflexi bacterium]|nr:PAS domain-containing protein [Chloroflexota bacterium]
MGFRSIRARIAVPYLLLIFLTMAALALYITGLVEGRNRMRLERQLETQARLLGDMVRPAIWNGTEGALGSWVRQWEDILQARVTVIASDGRVLADSHSDPQEMDNHLYRPEVQQALTFGHGSSVRYSRTLQEELLYVAVSVAGDAGQRAIVRLALPLADIRREVGQLRRTILVATLSAAGVALLLAALISERTARPLQRLREAVERITHGEFDAYLVPGGRDEMAALLRAFNRMAEQLRSTMSDLDNERAQLMAVLEHMADGVLITDGEGRVQLVNPSAETLLGIKEEQALGRSFAQVVREHQIIQFWQAYRATDKAQEELIEAGPGGSFVRCLVTPLPSLERGAALVILQDLSQIHRLETVRREFVSNISHELRTPLASLKVLVDTLRDGALDDPPAAARFLDRMEAEVDALIQMVDELLELSRIESGRVPLRLLPIRVEDVILPAVERLRPQAERAELSLEVALPGDLPMVLGDVVRLNQVVTNLVHNAIKFTPTGGRVSVSAECVADEVWVRVQDTGVGIAPETLPRIFERFYKGDPARSDGGAGLGLAIAKHIVQAHGGRIWAESVEGQGSTFFFSLLIAGSK